MFWGSSLTTYTPAVDQAPLRVWRETVSTTAQHSTFVDNLAVSTHICLFLELAVSGDAGSRYSAGRQEKPFKLRGYLERKQQGKIRPREPVASSSSPPLPPLPSLPPSPPSLIFPKTDICLEQSFGGSIPPSFG